MTMYKSRRGCYISLACSIGSLGIACGSLLQMNSTSDRIPLQKGLFLTSLGFVHFISLTDFFNKYLLETRHGIQMRRKYRLMMSDVMDITNKIVSAVQAAFSCLAGFIVCKSSCSKSFLYASHFVMEAYAWFGTAYFLYDIWSMYKVHTHKIADKLKLVTISTKAFIDNRNLSNGLYDKHTTGNSNSNNKNENDLNGSSNTSTGTHLRYHEEEMDYGENIQLPKDGRWDFLKYVLTHPIMVMHHIFIGTFGLVVIVYLRGGLGDCVYAFIYLMEFSTPFVSLRSILSTMGLKDTRLYITNGLVMLATFFICRLLMWPYVLYWYSEAINRPFIQAIMGLPRGCKISIMILFLPQIYWFSLMVKGALKVFLPSKNSSQPKIDRKPLQSNGTRRPNPIRNGSRSGVAAGMEENNVKRSASPVKSSGGSTIAQNMTQGRSLL